MEDYNPIKKFTPTQAYIKISRWCAYQERCQQEVRDKLYSYGLFQNDVEDIIARLISDNFLNEERFAIAFAGGKFRQLNWGKEKIKAALKLKRVSDYCIKVALKELTDKDYQIVLEKVFQKRNKEEKEKNALNRQFKIAAYLISRGFESDIVWTFIKAQKK